MTLRSGAYGAVTKRQKWSQGADTRDPSNDADKARDASQAFCHARSGNSRFEASRSARGLGGAMSSLDNSRMTARDASFAKQKRNTTLKKLLLTITAIVMSSPAYAWHPIIIYNNTDPLIHLVKFKSPGIAPQKFVVDTASHWISAFGPLREDGGPCLRHLIITVIDRLGDDVIVSSATPMDVCNEGWINITQTHVYPGGDTFVVTHGQGSGAAGRPGS